MDKHVDTEAQFLGELPALLVHKHAKRPERRQVSKRWLTSSVLVGVTSFLLMGGALYAALEGRQQLTLPAQAYDRANSDGSQTDLALKGNHPSLFAKLQPETEPSNIIMASTSTRQGDQVIVKAKPFMTIKASMATAPKPKTRYPAFNALSVFSDSGKAVTVAKSSDFMYGADVESEVALNISDFPYEEAGRSFKPRKNSSDIRRQVQLFASNLDVQTANYQSSINIETDRFASASNLNVETGDVTITAENVSILKKADYTTYTGTWYEDRLIEVRANASLTQILSAEGLNNDEIFEIVKVLSSDLGTDVLKAGDRLQAYFKHETTSAGDKLNSLASVSLFRGASHLVSIARPDNASSESNGEPGTQFVYAIPPESPEEIVEQTQQKEQKIISASKLPSIYDGIYRTALNEGLTTEMATSLIRMMAFGVDFRSRVSPTDNLEVFLSLEDGKSAPSDQSEILYAGITLGNVTRKYYRFVDEKGIVDYYDENGKSSKKFLLRKPVPNGKFRSAYGMRRHPISRRLKLHGGVDWSAPRGTPIISAGNGIVEKAGWSGGYGKQTIIRHANGYETSYSHQTAYAKGVKPGARVRQGQVIGYVGSTGYSTGPHLHYEVKVNGNRVDPMRIRLPKGKALKNEELATFLAEKKRIDELVNPKGNDKIALN